MLRKLAVGLAILSLWSCGGGDGVPPNTSQFAEAGNRICAEGDAELAEASDEALEARGDRELSLEETAAFFRSEALPIARRRLDDLAGLEPPAGDRQRLAELVAAGRAAVAEIERGLEEDGTEFLAASGPNPFATFDALALALGLSDCAGRPEETPADG